MVKIGIVRCTRDFECSGCNCFYAIKEHNGVFKDYNEPIEIVGITPCSVCKGGEINDELVNLKRYGANIIHLSSCHLAVYPPCPFIAEHKKHIEELLGLPVVVGTHPMPTSYVEKHTRLGDWRGCEGFLSKIIGDVKASLKYESKR